MIQPLLVSVNGIYGDDLFQFKCDTMHPGCRELCFNKVLFRHSLNFSTIMVLSGKNCWSKIWTDTSFHQWVTQGSFSFYCYLFMFQKLPLYFIYAIKVDLHSHPDTPDSVNRIRYCITRERCVTAKVQVHQLVFQNWVLTKVEWWRRKESVMNFQPICHWLQKCNKLNNALPICPMKNLNDQNQ